MENIDTFSHQIGILLVFYLIKNSAGMLITGVGKCLYN